MEESLSEKIVEIVVVKVVGDVKTFSPQISGAHTSTSSTNEQAL